MIRVAVFGARGRMGNLVCEAVEASDDLVLAARCNRPGPHELGSADVVVDFSLPAGTAALLPLLGSRALVTGTTGLSDELQAAVEAQATRGVVVQAGNFSTGVNVLLGLLGTAAAALPDYDVEIVEMHHRNKVDAPSGTAMALAGAVQHARGGELVHGREGHTGVRERGPIGMHALRGGDVAGEHLVYLAGPGERLQLGHLATGRHVFVEGALRAARWAHGRAPGLYGMPDVLGL